MAASLLVQRNRRGGPATQTQGVTEMSFESFANARRAPALLNVAKSLGFNEPELRARVAAEADGNATWARRAPGATGNVGDLALQVDVAAAVTASLALS
jgi:hypothetical protein